MIAALASRPFRSCATAGLPSSAAGGDLIVHPVRFARRSAPLRDERKLFAKPYAALCTAGQASSGTRKASGRRSGLTLIEVLLALAILAIVMGAVAQLVSIGTRAAQSAEETALAQIIAESKMNELASGAAPMAATGLTEYEGREGWQYSVDITTIEEPAGLVSVKVFVQQVVEGEDGVTFELYRWMPAEGFLDPALAEAPTTESETGSLTTGAAAPAPDEGTE